MSSSREARAERLVPALVFAAICALYAIPVLTNPAYWGKPDWDQFTFWNAAPREILLRYRQFPLWNPFSNGGNVLLAMPHSSFLSPQFALVLLFGPVLGLKLEWLAALFIGLLGTRRLSRRLGMGPLSSYLPPLVFMLSSHFSLHLREGHVEWTAMCLMPWAFLFLVRPESDRRGLAAAALILALMPLSGSVYVFAVTLFFLGIHEAVRAALDRSARPLIRLAGTLVLVFLLAAVKLVPMLEFLGASPRPTDDGGLMEPRTAASAFLDRRQNLLYEHTEQLPKLLGLADWGRQREKWHEFGAYVGVLPLLLALFGGGVRLRERLPLTVAGAACLWVACGRSPPVSLWTALHALPVYGSLHVPSRFLLGALFALALLAGFGVAELERSASPRRRALLAAGLLIVFLDLFTVLRPILANAFPIPPETVARQEPFRQGSMDDALIKQGSWSAMYPALLANRSVLDSYEIMHVPRGDVRTFWSPGYRGEAYLVPSGESARIVSFSPNRITVAVDPARGAAVLLNQNYFQGWLVRGSAGEVPAISVNGLLASPLKPGDSEITFFYHPVSFRVGLLLSALGLLSLLAFAGPDPDAAAIAAPPLPAPAPDAPVEISAVLPAFNERADVAATAERVAATLARLCARYEVIVVDDGSTDGTAGAVEELARRRPEVRLIRHEANRGYGAAVSSGLTACRHPLIFLTDADGQFDPDELERFLPLVAEKGLVIGRRRRRAEGPLRAAAAALWSGMIGVLLGVRARDVNCAFKLMRADAVKGPLFSHGAAVSAELLLRARRRGADWVEVPVEHYPRRHGRSTGLRPAVVACAFVELLNLVRSRP